MVCSRQAWSCGRLISSFKPKLWEEPRIGLGAGGRHLAGERIARVAQRSSPNGSLNGSISSVSIPSPKVGTWIAEFLGHDALRWANGPGIGA